MSQWRPYNKEDMLAVIQNGGFCCLLHKDIYDDVWGKWLEWGYETEESYFEEKERTIKNGLFERYLLQNLKVLQDISDC